MAEAGPRAQAASRTSPFFCSLSKSLFMLHTVDSDSARAVAIPRRSPLTSVTCALFITSAHRDANSALTKAGASKANLSAGLTSPSACPST